MRSIDRIVAQDAARTYAQNTDVTRSAAAASAAQQATSQASVNVRLQKTDSVELSSTARSVTAARQAVKNTPDVREQKVADIKQQLSDGTYQVSASVLARNMVSTSTIHA
jgi:negative regulator of flagellin synthesis FlgM